MKFKYVSDDIAIDFDPEVGANGYSSVDLGGYCVSTIPGTATGLLASRNMQYYFFFDKKGKLIQATVKEVRTGL